VVRLHGDEHMDQHDASHWSLHLTNRGTHERTYIMTRTLSRFTLGLVLAGGLFATSFPLWADRQVTYTLQTATRADITEVSIVRDNGGVIVRATYTIHDEADIVRVEGGLVEVVLTGPQSTQLVNFLDGVIVPAINAAESL
jgi:hypothetical protein